jgi:hypothetical protein
MQSYQAYLPINSSSPENKAIVTSSPPKEAIYRHNSRRHNVVSSLEQQKVCGKSIVMVNVISQAIINNNKRE